MTEDWKMDRELKLWMITVVALGSGAFVAALLVPRLEALFAVTGAPATLLTDAVLASVEGLWLLPVLALAGYLLRRRAIGSARAHRVAATALLTLGTVWLLVAVCGFVWSAMRT